jgi:hypothetical protein
MTSLDSAIVEEYGNFAIPADRIVADPRLVTTFVTWSMGSCRKNFKPTRLEQFCK